MALNGHSSIEKVENESTMEIQKNNHVVINTTYSTTAGDSLGWLSWAQPHMSYVLLVSHSLSQLFLV